MKSKSRLPLFLGILFTLPGWLIAFLTANSIVADIASIAGSIISLKLAWNCLGDSKEMIRFVRLGSIALCAIQNTSWLMASMLHRFSLDKSIELSLNSLVGNGNGISSYSLAVLYAGLFAASLSLFGSIKLLTKWESHARSMLHSMNDTSMKQLIFVVSICMLIEMLMLASGVIGQRSMVVEGYDEGKLPWWIPLYESLLPFHLLLNGLLFTKQYQLRRSTCGSPFVIWWIIIASIILISFLFFSKGRRSFVFSILAHGWWACFFLGQRPKLIISLFLIIVGYPVVSQVLEFNNFIRSSVANLENSRGSAIDVIPEAWRQFQEKDAMQAELLAQRNISNMATRPLVATALALCMDLPSNQKNFMWEKDILHSIIWTIPGPLFPNKILYPKQETLLYQNFPIGGYDIADSLYLSAYTCFGWVGIIVYPIFTVTLWIIVVSLASSRRVPTFVSAIIIASWLMTFMLDMGEGSAGRMLVMLRSSLAWIVFGWVIYFVSKGVKTQRLTAQPRLSKSCEP